MRKALLLFLCITLFFTIPAAHAQESPLAFVSLPDCFIPGSINPIVFSVASQGVVELRVTDSKGNVAAVISQSYEANQGENTLGWDGTYYGEAINEGGYVLTLSSNGQSVSANIQIGAELPMFTQVLLSDHVITAETMFSVTLASNIPADLTISVLAADGQSYSLGSGALTESAATIQWDGRVDGQPLPDGEYTLELILKEKGTDNVAVIEHCDLIIGKETEEAATEASAPLVEASIGSSEITPSYLSTHACTHENCYWNTPMDITNEAAVWDMLMAPMTIVSGEQKKQVKLYSEPDESSEAIAVVTCASQSVHVLETLDNGWTMVETYSSSFHDSAVKNWNGFAVGYLKTSQLKQVSPGNKEFGIVIDKLTQRLYLFQNGKMIAELLCSTGLANEKQPYNETRSGEFFLISAVGEFASDNLRCSYGLRFNSGDLLHEVPHLDNADGTNNYRNTEPKLGTRASHGCIRVQRLKNPDGINMRWIWDKIYRGIASKTVKMVIWEDFLGRQIAIPDASAFLYYNPDGGTSYHTRETCTDIKSKYLPLTAFTYGELETGKFASLTACSYCGPLRRASEIDEINKAHMAQ